MSEPATDVTTYRWSRAHVLRAIGTLVVGLGLAWLVLGIASGWRGQGILSTLPVIAMVVTGTALVAAAWLVITPPRVLELSPSGYRITHLRGGGVGSAGWTEVTSVDTRPVGGVPAIVVELQGGRTSTVPLSLLGPRAGQAQREMHDRLNTAFGYRRLNERS
jgi:hypothetical protein